MDTARKATRAVFTTHRIGFAISAIWPSLWMIVFEIAFGAISGFHVDYPLCDRLSPLA